MEKEGFNFLEEITPVKDSWKIKVRILRLWKQSFQTDMILMDEKGGKIHATVKKILIQNFERLLQEGSTVVINKFGVAENNIKFPIVKHEFKLNFYRNTTVKKCSDYEGPTYGFSFVSFDDIINNKVDLAYTVDVIGNVVSCGDMDVFNRNGKESKRVSLEIEDLQGNRLSCTLWDNFAQQFSSFVAGHNANEYVIVIIQFGKIREWRGNPTIQNSLFGSRLFINDDIEEINEFKGSLMLNGNADASSQMGTHLTSQTIYSARDEFLIKYERKHVDEIADIGKETVCVVLGTIKSVSEEYGWYYLACRKCTKKVIPFSEYVDLDDIDTTPEHDEDKETLFCPKCKIKAPSIVPRDIIICNYQGGS